MKNLGIFILLVICSIAFTWVLSSFYLFAIWSIIVGFTLRKKSWFTFGFCFFAGLIAWCVYALYIDILNDSVLSTRIGSLFGGVSPFILILLTGLIGGLILGLGGIAGGSFRELFQNKSKT